MSTETSTLEVFILDKSYRINCPENEQESLRASGQYLDRKMRELRANAKAPSFERLAVLAAISVTHEFLSLRKQHDGREQRLSDTLAALRGKLDAALETDPFKR